MFKLCLFVLGASLSLPAILDAHAPVAARMSPQGSSPVLPRVPAQPATKAPPTAPSPPQVPVDKLLQLHIAEYQAISARSTNWTTLQYGLMPLMAAALAILIANWQRFSSSFGTWAAALLYEAVMVAHLLVLSMLFNNVRYLECELRPAIEHLVGPGFWRYEHYMLTHSPYLPIGDYILPFQALIALLAASWFRLRSWVGWGGSDWVWAPAGAALFAFSLKLTGDVVAVHRNFMACAAR